MNANDFSPEFLNQQRSAREGQATERASRAFASARGAGLLLKDEVYQIVGCAIEVLNGIGHGLHEKPYENALVIEFGLGAVPFVQQLRYPILYKGINVGEYVPDLIALNAVVVDAKVIETITDHERGQMLNYLRITGHKVGVILNFRRARFLNLI
jgi:GxxExxY protein